jgi:hypothetical protein
MKTRAEFEVDLAQRVVTAHVWRELDVTPTDVRIPFSILKGIFGQITLAEAEAEKQAQNGGASRRLVSAG